MTGIRKMWKEFLTENFRRPEEQTPRGGDSTPGRSEHGSDKRRIVFIDLAKGVCILLVVLNHCGFTKDVPGIAAMRMPLYFILSGLFYKDYGGPVSFVMKKLNRILIPFFFFLILGLIPMFLIYQPSVIFEKLISPIVKPEMINLPLWFLICLFWTNILYFSIDRFFNNPYLKTLGVIIFGSAGWLLDHYDIYLPLFIGSALSASPFFYIGILIRRLPLLYSENKSATILGALLFLGGGFIYCILNDTAHIAFVKNNYHGQLIEIYAVSVCLVIGLLLACKAVGWFPIISYFGRYSIIVLGLHGIYILGSSQAVAKLTGYAMTDAEILAITLLLSWISIPLFRRFVPTLTAQKELFRKN